MNLEDDGATFQQQALEVREPDADFDPSLAPINGDEFLMHVVYERKQCPAVVVKRPPKCAEPNSLPTQSDDNKMPIVAELLPTTEWKQTQSADFISTRDQIAQMRQALAEQNYDQALDPPLTSDVVEWQRFCRENEPFSRIMLRLNQRTLEQLLEMISDWLTVDPEADYISPSSSSAVCNTFDLANTERWLGSWLYSTLTCLHLPLEPDVHSTLRDIARSCIRLRSRLLRTEIEKAVPYNLFIHLISSVFDQLDFAEFV